MDAEGTAKEPCLPSLAGADIVPFRREADPDLQRLVDEIRAALDPDDVELEFLFRPDGDRYRRRFLSGSSRTVKTTRRARDVDEPDTALSAPFRVDQLVDGTLLLVRRARRRWTAAERARFALLGPFLSHLAESLARAEVHETARRRLRTVAHRSAVPILTFSTDGLLLYANPSANDLFARQVTEGFCVLLDDCRQPLLVHIQRLACQQPLVQKERLPLTNGRSLEAHIAPGSGPEDDEIRVVTVHERAAVTIDDARPHLLARGVSERESEVVGCVLAGLRNAEIARELFISEYTVKDHLKHVFHKLGVDSRGGLIRALYRA